LFASLLLFSRTRRPVVAFDQPMDEAIREEFLPSSRMPLPVVVWLSSSFRVMMVHATLTHLLRTLLHVGALFTGSLVRPACVHCKYSCYYRETEAHHQSRPLLNYSRMK
jgi:hypothetical protein